MNKPRRHGGHRGNKEESFYNFKSKLRATETVNQLEATIHRALNSRVFGVPTFIVSGKLFWGNDRIVLLRHYLETEK